MEDYPKKKKLITVKSLNIPHFPDYKAHFKAFNFLQKTTVRLIVQCALYMDHSLSFSTAPSVVAVASIRCAL